MITRSRELIVKDTMDVSVYRHENGSVASATLSFRSVNGSHRTSIHLTLDEAIQLSESLVYIAGTEQ